MKPKSKSKSKSLAAGAPEWKSEPIPGDFFSCQDFDSLISLEVLTDYGIEVLDEVKNTKNRADNDDVPNDPEEEENGKSKSNRKRKSSDSDAPTVKKAKADSKKTKATKIKIKSAQDSESDDDVNITVESTTDWEVLDDDEHSDEEQNETVHVEAKPKQKLKQKQDKKTTKLPKKEDIVVPKIKSKTFNLPEWTKLGIPDSLLKALEENKFDEPTPIQKLTLGATVLGQKDCVGAAETGSGKTLAFAIPIIFGIQRLRNEAKDNEQDEEGTDEADSDDGLKALILTPTRELAVQIKKHIDAISTYANVDTVVIVGGLAPQKQERLLRQKPDIVIATPGRLWELVQDGNEHLSALDKIRFLAVDETDRMVEKGHFQELQGILNTINRNSEASLKRQNFVFSATLAFTHEPPQRLKSSNPKIRKKNIKKISPQEKLRDIMAMIGVKENAKIVDITSGKGTCETLTEMSITCPLAQKDYYLYYFFVKHPGRTIVFCNSINCVRRLVNLFYLLQCEPLALHSEMHQKQRLRNLERFAANDKGILIATDVAARGLDIVNIEHVIHYQVPKTAESYIHRSGRTARAYKGGIAVVFIEPAEVTTFKNISRSLGRTELLPSFPIEGQFFREIKARVDTAIKVEQFEHTVRKKCADTNWIEKAKKEMDLASSDEDSDRDIDGKQEIKKNIKEAKHKLEVAKAQLAQLLALNSRVLRTTNTASPVVLNTMK